MKAPDRTPFVLTPDGALLVQLDAVMAPIVALVDGLPLAAFEDDDRTFIAIDTAIEWCREEAKHGGRGRHDEILDALERARAKHERGEIVEI